MEKGLNCPNRQWEIWTSRETEAIADLRPRVLLVLAYGDDSPWQAQTEQHLSTARQIGARLQVRMYAPDIPRRDPREWAEECVTRANRYGETRVEIIPGNEMNLECEGGNADCLGMVEWLGNWAVAYRLRRPQDLLHLPALSPCGGFKVVWRDLRAIANRYDIVDVHEYPGTFGSHREAADLFGKPISVTEFNGTNPGEYLTSLNGMVRDASWFILCGTEDHRQHWLLDDAVRYASFRDWRPPTKARRKGMLINRVYVTDLREALPTGQQGYAWRELDQVQRIVIHHVGGANRDFTAEEIARYHVEHNGWPGIGYHFLVHPDGRLEYVGDVLTARYHAGRLNQTSVGICLCGDFTTEQPSKAALSRCRQLLNEGLFPALGKILPVHGHRDVWQEAGVGATSCPGDTWPRWKARVLAI